MTSKALMMAAAICAAAWFAPPAAAQVQLNVCGAPPLPPCRPEPRERVIIERERPAQGRVERLSDVCRTRTLRCQVDEPRPVGARCTCEDPDGEEIVGRIR
jgi:hypothetical protein